LLAIIIISTFFNGRLMSNLSVNNMNPIPEEEEVPSTPPPDAPIKARRRRRPLLDRWRGSPNSSNSNNTIKNKNKKSPIEDYYRVGTVHAASLKSGVYYDEDDTANTNNKHNNKQQHVKVLLPGLPRYEADSDRDAHDFFNLVVLVPITVLNVMNWNWDKLALVLQQPTFDKAILQLQHSWTGDWFTLFFATTATYFITDLIWIWRVPHAVKSPTIILQHHAAVLLYLLIPYYHPPVRYCMGACLTVELNTWFLIARRVFNQQGFPPWTLALPAGPSLRIKVISIGFYLTWISIRCLLYPALLVPFYRQWRDWSAVVGTDWNILLPVLPLHAAFCLLNLKWTYELVLSKLRYHKRQRRFARQQYNHNNSNNNPQQQHLVDPYISKGL